MANAVSAPGINWMAINNPQVANQQLDIQRQQALAQQLMDQGNQQQDPAQLANPGGFVVPVSPWAAAARALAKTAGGYEQSQAIDKQKDMNSQLAASMMGNSPSSNPQNGAPLPWSGSMTPDDQQAAQQNLAQALMGKSQAPQIQGNQTAMNDPQFRNDATIVGPEDAYKGYLARTSPTDMMKNNNYMGMSPQLALQNTQAEAANKSGIPGAYLTPQGAAPIPNAIPIAAAMAGNTEGAKASAQFPYQSQLETQKATQTPFKQTVMVNGNPTDIVTNNASAATGSPPAIATPAQPPVFPGQAGGNVPLSSDPQSGNPAITPQPPEVRGPQPSAPVTPVTQSNVSLAVPVGAVEGAKASSEESAKNSVDASKTLAGMEARINNAKAILQRQIDLAPKTFEGTMGEDALQPLAENWKNIPLPDSWKPTKYGDPAAQHEFEQNSANLALQAMPGLVPPGSRLDIPIVKMMQTAEQIPPYATAESKIAVARNQMQMLDFASQNLFNNADLMKELSAPEGTPLSPKMQALHADLQKSLSGSPPAAESAPPTKTINGVTYTKINGVWHQ